MRLAIVSALALALLLPAGAAAQDYPTEEVEAPWSDDGSGEMIETLISSDQAVLGYRDDDYCRLMSAVLTGEVDDLAVSRCTTMIENLPDQVWLPETHLRLIDPPVAAKPVRIKGKGSKSTQPFLLAAGDYRVQLNKSRGCDQFTYGYLMSTSLGRSASDEISQAGFVYGVEEGRHYWDATADNKCKWTYVLTPLE